MWSTLRLPHTFGMVSRVLASFVRFVLFLFGLCSLANAWGGSSPTTKSPPRDVVISDSCGQTTFDAAGVDTCNDPTFDKLMPVAILWVNCKYAGAGIRQLTCDGVESNTLVRDAKILRACVAGLSSSAFLQVLQYTMSAFDVCEQHASAHSATTLRKSVTFLVNEARKSSELQSGTRIFLQDMVDKSANLVEAEKRLQAGSQRAYVASTAALSSSKGLTVKLAAAFEELRRDSEELRKIDEATQRTLNDVFNATLRLSEDLANSLDGIEGRNALTAQNGKRNIFESVITLSIANAVLVSAYDVFRLRRDSDILLIPLPSVVRLASSLLCLAAMLSGRSFLFAGSRAIENFIFSTVFCAGVSLWDCMLLRRAFHRLCKSDISREHDFLTAASHLAPTDSCGVAYLSVEAYSFEPCDTCCPSKPRETSLSPHSISSMASGVCLMPVGGCESPRQKDMNPLSEDSSRESIPRSKGERRYSSSHAYVEDSQ